MGNGFLELLRRANKVRILYSTLIGVTVLVAAGTVGVADSSVTYNGCENLASGAVRLLTNTSLVAPWNQCLTPSNPAASALLTASPKLLETAVTWNQVGPQGPQGAQGPAGEMGVPGPVGAQGPAGFGNSVSVSSTTPVSIYTSAWATIDSVSFTLQGNHTVAIQIEMLGPAADGERLIVDGSPIQSDGVSCSNSLSPNEFITPALACGPASINPGASPAFNWSVALTAGPHTMQSQAYFTSNGVPVYRAVTVHSLTVLDLGG